MGKLPSKKRKSPKLTVLFSELERETLDTIAVRDKREAGPEVKWLVEAYAKGDLLTKSEAFEIARKLSEARRSPVDLREKKSDGEAEQESRDLHNKEGRRLHK